MSDKVVLDASALIALMFREPGGEMVAPRIEGALISAVNASEVADRFARDGVAGDRVRSLIANLKIGVVSSDADAAFDASDLYQSTRRFGLSLGDRFCLALARRSGRPVLTADRRWSEVADLVGVEVELIR